MLVAAGGHHGMRGRRRVVVAVVAVVVRVVVLGRRGRCRAVCAGRGFYVAQQAFLAKRGLHVCVLPIDTVESILFISSTLNHSLTTAVAVDEACWPNPYWRPPPPPRTPA